MGNIVPEYIKQLISALSEHYLVEYYIEQWDTTVFDCFILNGFCIKINRMSEIQHTISQSNLRILINAIQDIYTVLIEQAKELGWDTDDM
ncbi:MAG: hypothetical protein PHU12_04155 [Candidatus Aenigmarchaeota archaeon]|jgi:hypothetical protein|nr:hypothetical protein [Candidatus Aenigmarchaeota archaeon]